MACGASSPARWLHALGQTLPAAMLLLLSSPVHGQAIRALQVQKIILQHIGQPAASDALIRANIRLKPGDTYSRKASDDDIHNLRNTGFFENVYVTEKRVADEVEITYTLVGKPVVTEILFDGNTGGRKFRESKLRKKIRSRTGETLSRPRIFADTRALLKEYQKGGYHQAKVDYEVRHDEALGQATVVFQVEPGRKVKIDDIVFGNALAFSQRELRKVLKTRRRWFMSWLTGSGKLETDQWEEDLDRLTQFYQDEGYIDFEVREIDFSDPSDGGMVISFDLYEGYRYQVGSVAFEGNTLFTDDQIRRGVQVLERAVFPYMLEGAIFTPTGLNEDRDAIRDFYEAHGYLDTIVRSTRVPNTDQGTIDLVYTIQEGELSYVEKVEIRGNNRTKDKVIRRELAISPGEVFDMVRVELSKRRLEGTALFEAVDTQVEKIPELPNRRNLIIGVQEGRTGHFLMGFGYSSIEAMFAQVGFVQGNFDLFNPPFFTGAGQKFRLQITAGSRRKDYQITFEEPWLFDQKKRLSVDLYHREIQYYSRYFEQHQTGTRLGYSQRILNDRVTAGVNYTIESIGIHDRSYFADMLSEHDMLINGLAKGYPDSLSANPFDWTYDTARIHEGELSELNHNRLVSQLGLFLEYGTLNSAILPSRGHLTRLKTEIAGGPFGGDTEMYRLEVDTAHYYPGFGVDHIWEVIGKLGVVDTFGDSRRVPYFDRFFLGGAYSLRGYDYRDIGPRMQTWEAGVDENDQFGYWVNEESEDGKPLGQKFVPVKRGGYSDNPFHKIPEITPADGNRWTPVIIDGYETLGGSSYWYGSVEYSIPIINQLRVAIFYDVGMVYEDPYEFEFSNYADNWGVGLRLNVPMLGPLRLDYGIPISHPDYLHGGGGEFNFGVGFNRSF
ncbi:MAG: outer membrane protein assembly factor BamA [Verrucomicrobiota bacterium]|nr:outer membrane protein assembly factor BamA [Verrucomicrobiota bacterium]